MKKILGFMKKKMGFLVLGAFAFFSVVSIILWRASGRQPLLTGAIQHPSANNSQAYYASGEFVLELSAFVLTIIGIGVLIMLFVLLAVRLHKSLVSPKSLVPLKSPISPDVLEALRRVLLDPDEDSGVRSKAAVGLSELDIEESSHHYDHNQLDNILISALNARDGDHSVRSKVVEGLTEVELELITRHKHDQPEDARLQDMARTFK